jgi:peptide chain release factor
MILLQLSAGQGPIECEYALGLALKTIDKQCQQQGLTMELVEAIEGAKSGCFKSLLLQLKAPGDDTKAKQFAQSWQGVMLWVCQSRFRPKHKRKNWFFSAMLLEINEQQLDQEVKFQTCRASGAGGQHVNTTDSAVRATHVSSGLSVRVESERSQHANKRLARALLWQKLEANKQAQMNEQEKARWQQHHRLERGNPVKTFKGEQFKGIDHE